MPANTPASGALPIPRQAYGTYQICLVCLGNICRSPMAEVVLRDVLTRSGLAGAVSVESAGTGDWHVGERMFGPARAELARRGYDGSTHRARQIQPSWLPRYDLVVAMDRANLAALHRMAPDPDSAARIRLLRTFDPELKPDDPYQGEVPDPFGGSADDYALAFDLVLAAATGLAGQLAALPDAPTPGRT
jgi:protein-tyrosine phosphatase